MTENINNSQICDKKTKRITISLRLEEEMLLKINEIAKQKAKGINIERSKLINEMLNYYFPFKRDSEILYNYRKVISDFLPIYKKILIDNYSHLWLTQEQIEEKFNLEKWNALELVIYFTNSFVQFSKDKHFK
ncbi:MAG: hypothetical protein ACD_4C00101G0009 [uncultured bacterium (gcode 4)]|uniref:Uncharacterized protein n=1 Tax=uncultured bacterium (gcode 4) TaxID=1234023 RepID=K2FYJ4_9BACT|nr:MAG: hypothetical protein ACD_4C00101G0009 [uncultured bacterium (gcode 4)]